MSARTIQNKVIADNYKKLQSMITLSKYYHVDPSAYKVYIHSLDLSFESSNNIELGILDLFKAIIDIIDHEKDIDRIKIIISEAAFILPFAQEPLANKKRRSVAYIEKIAYSFNIIIEIAVKTSNYKAPEFKRIITLICDYPMLSKYIISNIKSIL